MSAGALLNISLILIMLFLVGVLIFFKLTDNRNPRKDPHKLDKKYTFEGLIEYVKTCLNEMTTSNIDDLGLSEEEYTRRMNQRLQLQKALKNSPYGDLQDKNYVKNTIFDLLLKTYGLNDENINRVIPFDNKKLLTSKDKHDILLHLYKKKHGSNALGALFEAHGLAELKNVIEGGTVSSYIITDSEIHEVYQKEIKPLSFEDKLQIIVQRIYEQYKGLSVIDEIRDMKIDGVSGGVSGVPIDQVDLDDYDLSFVSGQLKKKTTKYSHDSIWVFYKGKPIHLAYLTFGTESELKRVCQNIYRYNNPGQLSDSNGFKVNDMKDGSRVVVVRPGFSESWAFFVRKFDIANATLDQLIPETIVGRELVSDAIKFLVKGARVMAITGPQGAGKTTLLMAMIKYIDATYRLRVQETAFELHLRKIYGDRNILTFRETETISGQAGLDLSKKTDGDVNILGELATDPVAAYMIQTAQVASLFSLFTHHAKTFKNLVFSIRNSLLKTNIFTDEKIAEEQVVSVLNFDIHLKRDPNGFRYIERITECIPLDYQDDYPTDFRELEGLEEKVGAFMETATEYFRRKTDRRVFTERNIIEYRTGGYIAVNPISERNKSEMLAHMSDVDQMEFKQFIDEHWSSNINGGEEAWIQRS
ncbi:MULTISPECIES: ATPase, T2SS/T4P/T4SS family [unclassified Paenibacillus]|uniref:ATPase, T2SS/T4P/T4SS family n=1 Tax=Paenibacillus provencensis TaxID=441151 RepID=A0ABW3Q2P1_9BACL|nr:MULTISPECIES: ATPase, T2SS/T4P/T4SS family [unclassified Paenibacillus]MCM3130595.1 Flp pilus assembly complex ATPase component TadA [Paenibacillus sp. MER 78]SDX74930.1 pilus assembly protein CpaF [Paenibacillus sp. PDC88]SFS90041.1 pilus assembly protein CpaF [Paenibacillus sp. 453mf]